MQTLFLNNIKNDILKDDILYQDDLVCILKPEVKKGIIVWTNYRQPSGIDSISKIGLKTGKKLAEEGIDFGRSIYHPYIFFRAPYYSNEIDYQSIEKEIESSYGFKSNPSQVYIRVDPEKTYVFSSEIRARMPTPVFHIDDGRLLSQTEIKKTHCKFFMPKEHNDYKSLYQEYYDNQINKSKKTLSQYLEIIKYNELYDYNTYNLFSSLKVNMKGRIVYPYDTTPINRNSEILVSIPHLTPNYFVKCT